MLRAPNGGYGAFSNRGGSQGRGTGFPTPPGSESASTSGSSLDYNAKAATDAQIQQGLDYAKLLRGETSNAADARISTLNDSFAELENKVSQLGSYDRNRIDRDAQSRSNSVGAQLAGTGLYNSTVLPTLRQGVERDRLEAQGQLDESLRNQNISTLLSKIQSVDAARLDQISFDSELGQAISELYALMGRNQPTASSSESNSSSTSAWRY
ncbi:MAG: hypothetical protein AAFV88_04405 [Planctomycetota bacterium]